MAPINLDKLEEIVCGPKTKTAEETLSDVEQKLANIEEAVRNFNKKTEPEPEEPGDPGPAGSDDGAGSPGKE